MCDKENMESMPQIDFACNVLCAKGRKIGNSRRSPSLLHLSPEYVCIWQQHKCGPIDSDFESDNTAMFIAPMKNAASDYNTAFHIVTVCVCGFSYVNLFYLQRMVKQFTKQFQVKNQKIHTHTLTSPPSKMMWSKCYAKNDAVVASTIPNVPHVRYINEDECEQQGVQTVFNAT